MFGPWWIISFSLHFFFLLDSYRYHSICLGPVSGYLKPNQLIFGSNFSTLKSKMFPNYSSNFRFCCLLLKIILMQKKEREYNSMKALKNWYLVIFNLFWSYWISFFFVLVLRHSRCIVNFQCFNLDVSIINQSWSDLVPNRNPLLGKFSANNSVLFL